MYELFFIFFEVDIEVESEGVLRRVVRDVVNFESFEVRMDVSDDADGVCVSLELSDDGFFF